MSSSRIAAKFVISGAIEVDVELAATRPWEKLAAFILSAFFTISTSIF